jgi:exosortase A
MTLWRPPLTALGLVTIALLALFWRDSAAMAGTWWNSSTFTHCLFIMPLVGWLIWMRKDEVAQLSPRGFAPGLALVGLGALAWLVGQAAGVNFIRQAALVFMIQASVLTILGPQVTRGLLFPLFYLSFLVPFGEELIPPMQTITAKLCMVFLGWAGIPAHIEGVFISIPSGNFEVAEACSGVKFLVAMIAYAALAANVCFKSWGRRIAFMAMAVTVPIIANGFRAYSTIHISHLTSAKFAETTDHIIYGWVFFGLVMLLVMAVAWKFFDRKLDDPWLSSFPRKGGGPDSSLFEGLAPRLRGGTFLPAAIFVVALLPMLWQAALSASGRTPLDHAISLPEIKGWQRVRIEQSYAWRPRFDRADHQLFGQYANAAGQRVDLAIILFGWQDEGRELVGYAHGAADPQTRWSWANDTAAPPNGKGERLFAPGVAREVLSFYGLGGITTGNENVVKIETLKVRLFGGDQAAVAVLVSAEDNKASPSRAAIDAFLRDVGPVNRLSARMVAQARGQ